MAGPRLIEKHRAQMRDKNRLTQRDVEKTLAQLGTPFEAIGQVEGYLGYASLRAPGPSGIYYLAAGATTPESITDSLILTDICPEVRSHTNAYILLSDPQLAFYKLMRASQGNIAKSGIHPTALIDPNATVSETAYVGAYCIIEADVDIGAGCQLDSHVVVKSNSSIGADTHIGPHCTIAAIGIAWVWDETEGERVLQPQTGSVVIGRSVFIGSDVAIVRGSVNEATEIGDGTVIAHGSKIGHGCRIGKDVHLANNVSLAGNVDVGSRVFFGSGAIARPRVAIADRVVVGAGAVVIQNIEETGAVVGGVPAKKLATTKKRLAGVPYSSETRGFEQ